MEEQQPPVSSSVVSPSIEDETMRLSKHKKRTILGTLFFIILGAVLGFAYIYGTQYWNSKKALSKVEAPPTVESFRKGYVQGCELTPSTFTFSDGFIITGEFASCPQQMRRTFSTTTEVVTLENKKKITTHAIVVHDATSTYPIVIAYGTSGMFSAPGVLASTSTKANPNNIMISDVEKTATAKVSSDNKPLYVSFADQFGYIFGLFSISTGYYFDSSTLRASAK